MARIFRLIPQDAYKSLMDKYDKNDSNNPLVPENTPSASIKGHVTYDPSTDFERSIFPLPESPESSFTSTLASPTGTVSDKSLMQSMRRSMNDLLECDMNVSEKMVLYNNALYNYLKLKKEVENTPLKGSSNQELSG